MKNRSKQKSKRKLRRIAIIITVTILICLSYMTGFNMGLNNISESQTNPPKNGEYNITIHEGGKVTITTRIQYIFTNNDKLIVYGKPIHEPIE